MSVFCRGRFFLLGWIYFGLSVSLLALPAAEKVTRKRHTTRPASPVSGDAARQKRRIAETDVPDITKGSTDTDTPDITKACADGYEALKASAHDPSGMLKALKNATVVLRSVVSAFEEQSADFDEVVADQLADYASACSQSISGLVGQKVRKQIDHYNRLRNRRIVSREVQLIPKCRTGTTSFERAQLTAGKYIEPVVSVPAPPAVITVAAASNQLVRAVIDGDVERISAALTCGADVSARTLDGYSALACAMMRNDDAAISLLLSHGVDTTLPEPFGEGITPIHTNALFCAIAYDCSQRIGELLLDANPRLVESNQGGDTPWIKAAAGGNLSMLKAFANKGIDFVTRRDEKGLSALHFAAFRGKLEAVEYLLDIGVPVDIRDIKKLTPMYFAAVAGHLDVVRALHSRGASVRPVRGKTTTALHAAAKEGHCAILEYLLPHIGPSIDSWDDHGVPALHRAASYGHVEIVRLLLAAGASVNSRNSARGTALHEAAFNGKKEVVELLLRHNAEVNIANINGYTALHFAAEGYSDIVKLLIDSGSNLHAREELKGDTPLHLAVRSRCLRAVQYLLDAGACVNVMNSCGQYPYDSIDRAYVVGTPPNIWASPTDPKQEEEVRALLHRYRNKACVCYGRMTSNSRLSNSPCSAL